MKRIYRGIVVCFLLLYGASLGATEKRFSLAIHGGFGSTKVGDLNSSLSSVGSKLDEMKETYPEQVTGEIGPIPTKFENWEAELRWAFWQRFSIGISLAGPTHHYGNSSYMISNSSGTASATVSYESEINISAPLKLNLYYSFPVHSRAHLIINGGIGRYQARIIRTEQAQEVFSDGSSYLGSMVINVRGKTIGYHCGLALEYRINERLTFMAESQWQFAKIKSLDGNLALSDYEYDASGNVISSGNDSWDGILYHYMGYDSYFGTLTEKLVISEFYPWDGIDFPSEERKAFLDLSGFTFKIGLKIGLF